MHIGFGISLLLLGTHFFLKNTPTHIDFVTYKALITQNILFLGDVIKVMWLVWEIEFGKALGDIIFVFFFCLQNYLLWPGKHY